MQELAAELVRRGYAITGVGAEGLELRDAEQAIRLARTLGVPCLTMAEDLSWVRVEMTEAQARALIELTAGQPEPLG